MLYMAVSAHLHLLVPTHAHLCLHIGSHPCACSCPSHLMKLHYHIYNTPTTFYPPPPSLQQCKVMSLQEYFSAPTKSLYIPYPLYISYSHTTCTSHIFSYPLYLSYPSYLSYYPHITSHTAHWSIKEKLESTTDLHSTK